MEDVKADFDSIRDAARRQAQERPWSRWRRPAPTRPPIDWDGYDPVRCRVKPGRARRSTTYDLAELRGYIDWQPFFNAWEMQGKFPDILNNPATGETARKLYDDAQEMLDRLVEEGWLEARGVVGLFPANARRRRHRGLHRRVAHRGADHAAQPAPAGPAPRRACPTARWPTTSRPRTPASPTTSAGSRSPPGIGSEAKAAEFKAQLDDYSRDPARVARRPARRGVRRAAARAGPQGAVGLRARREARQRGADQGAVRRHPARPGLPRVSRPHREAQAVGAPRRARRPPASG